MKFWIARDSTDGLYLHFTKPKGDDYWFINERFIRIDGFLFPEVTFENSPQMVEVKLVKNE